MLPLGGDRYEVGGHTGRGVRAALLALGKVSSRRTEVRIPVVTHTEGYLCTRHFIDIINVYKCMHMY